MDSGCGQTFHPDLFLPYSQSSLQVLPGVVRYPAQLVQDAEVEQAVRTRDMHRLELGFSDCQGFAETRNGFMRQVLLEIVQANQKVRVACFQAVIIEELLD